MANSTQRVQFAKGLKSTYFSAANGAWNEDDFAGVIFFASDSNEIYVDGTAYGIGGTVLQTLKSNNFVSKVEIKTDAVSHNQQIYIKYYDTNGTAQESTVDLYKVTGADAIKVNHVSTTEKVEGEDVTKYSNDYEISLKLESDNILSQSATGLKANLSLNYNSGKVILKGINGAEISSIDLNTLITKDSFLESGAIVTIDAENKEVSKLEIGDVAIKLTFKTTGASTSTTDVYVPANKLVDTYSAGNGIEFGVAGNGNSGSGVPVSIKLKSSNSHLTVDANGLAVDISTITGADLKIDSTTDAPTIASKISTLNTEIEGLDTSVVSILGTLSSLDATDISVGVKINDSILATTNVKDAIKALQDQIDTLAPKEGESYDTATLSTYIDNVNKSAGFSNIGNFVLANYNGTLAAEAKVSNGEGGERNVNSIAEVIVAEDASLRALISALDSEISGVDASLKAISSTLENAVFDYRVNDVKGVSKTDSSNNVYVNIALDDSQIPVNENSVSGGVLDNVSTVGQALASINTSITWQYFDESSQS